MQITVNSPRSRAMTPSGTAFPPAMTHSTLVWSFFSKAVSHTLQAASQSRQAKALDIKRRTLERAMRTKPFNFSWRFVEQVAHQPCRQCSVGHQANQHVQSSDPTWLSHSRLLFDPTMCPGGFGKQEHPAAHGGLHASGAIIHIHILNDTWNLPLIARRVAPALIAAPIGNEAQPCGSCSTFHACQSEIAIPRLKT